LAKAARASGKFGGVAGVLAGVHNWNRQKERKRIVKIRIVCKMFQHATQRIGKKKSGMAIMHDCRERERERENSLTGFPKQVFLLLLLKNNNNKWLEGS
jgi:uncharacterized cysteine cluster protein YcgN (CxxCxxCC family)